MVNLPFVGQLDTFFQAKLRSGREPWAGCDVTLNPSSATDLQQRKQLAAGHDLKNIVHRLQAYLADRLRRVRAAAQDCAPQRRVPSHEPETEPTSASSQNIVY